MTSAPHYRANLRDVSFNLFEVLRIQDTTIGKGAFGLDRDEVEGALSAVAELAEGPYGAGFAAADREGLRFDGKGNVQIPKGVRDSLDAYFGADWHLLESPQALGGYGAPPSVAWAAFEFLAGSHAAATFYLLGAVNARVIANNGTPAQIARFARPAVQRKWGGTMCLTEAEAGSDVGEARSSAVHVEADMWKLSGTKRFITNGDSDVFENILHLVLARREGAAPGTKGLSTFIVPKFIPKEDGSPGERNGFWVTKVEHKMGLHASATCEMVMGDDRGPCFGWLVGDRHDGIRQMFQVIEHARMAVGVKSFATLSAAYINALAYARDRVQGPDLARATEKTAPRVEILRHPDVRRMLMAQKASVEGLRSLALYTAWVQDQVELQGGHGSEGADAMDRRNDLLLPLVKGYGSERCWEMLTLSLQTLGGSGYICDHPMEQYLRDQKIDSLYEGTTHIQSLDLLFRKIARDGGQTFGALLEEIKAEAEDASGGDALAETRQRLLRALGDMEGLFAALMGKMEDSIYHVGLHANVVLQSVAELVVGWRLLVGARVAAAALSTASKRDIGFYNGKIAAAHYWSTQVLPNLTLARKRMEQSDLSLMSLNDAAF